jgi:hypothetical protein
MGASSQDPLLSLMRRIENLERAQREQAAAQTANATTIDKDGLQFINGGSATFSQGGGAFIQDGGSLELFTADGVAVFYIGTQTIPDGSGRKQEVLQIARSDGSPAFAVGDFGTVLGHPFQQVCSMYDKAGNTIFAEDAQSGTGLANPYIASGGFIDLTVPTATTTSTSYAALQWADHFQQHPNVTEAVLVYTPSGTTGQIRLTVGGVQIVSASIPSNTFTVWYLGPIAWPTGTFAVGQRVLLALEAKVNSGAGPIGVRGMGPWGVQS